MDDYYRTHFYSSSKPDYIREYTEDREWWNSVYDRIYDCIEFYWCRRKILDMGCGPGFFLARGMQRGWDVTGVEIAPEAVNSCQSLGVRCVPSIEEAGEEYGAVSLYEVLEHLPDPELVLRKSRDILISPGILAVTVPNDYNPLQLQLRKHGVKPYWLSPPEHLNYFNEDDLCGLLDRAGFRTVRRLSSFPMEIFLLLGMDYIGNPVVGRQCHQMRIRFESMVGRDLLEAIYVGLGKLRIGREITIVAIKR